jgi:hypothetical protein
VKTLLLGSLLQMLALMALHPASTGSLRSIIVSASSSACRKAVSCPSYAIIVREYLPAREAGARVGFVIMATIVGMALGGWISG